MDKVEPEDKSLTEEISKKPEPPEPPDVELISHGTKKDLIMLYVALSLVPISFLLCALF